MGEAYRVRLPAEALAKADPCPHCRLFHAKVPEGRRSPMTLRAIVVPCGLVPYFAMQTGGGQCAFDRTGLHGFGAPLKPEVLSRVADLTIGFESCNKRAMPILDVEIVTSEPLDG